MGGFDQNLHKDNSQLLCNLIKCSQVMNCPWVAEVIKLRKKQEILFDYTDGLDNKIRKLLAGNELELHDKSQVQGFHTLTVGYKLTRNLSIMNLNRNKTFLLDMPLNIPRGVEEEQRILTDAEIIWTAEFKYKEDVVKLMEETPMPESIMKEISILRDIYLLHGCGAGHYK